MSDMARGVRGHAAELRCAFDRGFAEPLREEQAAATALLAVRVGGQPCAMRLTEIAGLSADKTTIRIPGSDAALIGVAGFRGAIVPVYSLQALLGYSPAPQTRWLVIAAAAPVALAFEALQGQLNVAADAILAAPKRDTMPGFARDFVRTENFSGPVLHIASLLDVIRNRRGEAVPREEQ